MKKSVKYVAMAGAGVVLAAAGTVAYILGKGDKEEFVVLQEDAKEEVKEEPNDANEEAEAKG